ncbi:MAG: phage tail protein, partial [Synergistaceae bacterium]|nr:phage tail protein [Synergistaceae bacterium]
MVTIAVGALLGWAFSGVLIGWGIVTTAFGAIMLGASLGSRFMPRDTSDFSSSPTYSFGPISNTMSQLVPIPVIYGTCRVAGNIIYQAFADDKKELQDLYILIGEGPVTAIHSVLANDQDPAALEDCSVSKYLNTTTATRDARDPSGARPYPDDVALICLTLKAQEKLNGTPTVTSIVDGVKVWTPSGFTWSRNPVWIILDILCHPRYGLGYGAVTNGIYQHPDWDKIDYACAVASAAYCDGIVSYGTRFQLDFVLDTQRPIRDVLADFLASCRGYLVESDKLQICIDAPVSTYSREITPDNIVEGSFTFWQAADEDVCNRITIDWIDPNNSYERVTDVFQDSADIADRGVVEKAISLLPVTRSGQVGHMGYYLLKTSLMVRDFCSFGVGLKDCDIMPGEVLRVTFESFTGWNKKPFRVVSVKDSGQDVMTVTCSEYIRDVYDDSVLDITHHIDTSLTTNYKPDDVTEMAIAEQLETLQDGSYNLIAKISWTPPASYSSLELWYRYSSEVSWKPAGTLPRGSEEYYLPCTGNIGDTLYAKIYVVSRLGIRSDGQTVSKILRGDLTPPAAPTNLKGTGGFRCALLTWADPGDGDLDHIEIYRSTESNTDDMTKIGIAPRFAQEYADGNLYALQTAWYRLKAVDVAGNKSEYSDIISVTSEALKHEDIPEQSLTPSKFIPELERAIEEIKALSAASIINSVNEDENRDAAAKATQELKTRVVAGLEAEAEARTQLAAQVDNHAAAIVAEQAARAEADQAEAEARTQLAAQVDNHAA